MCKIMEGCGWRKERENRTYMIEIAIIINIDILIEIDIATMLVDITWK